MEILSDFTASVIKSFDEIDSEWRTYEGLVVCGTHNPQNVEETIVKIKEARITGFPFLGICWGHQLAAIEYARNVLGIKDATSEELGTEGTLVVKRLPYLNIGLQNGESYWNNYAVVIETKYPDNFFTTQSHPEYQSSIDKPHPLLKSFLLLCKKFTVERRQV